MRLAVQKDRQRTAAAARARGPAPPGFVLCLDTAAPGGAWRVEHATPEATAFLGAHGCMRCCLLLAAAISLLSIPASDTHQPLSQARCTPSCPVLSPKPAKHS